MLFGFEGTGMQMWTGTWGPALNDLSGTTSYVWRFTQFTTDPISRYFPGPNVQGSNCDNIFEMAKKEYRALKKSGAVNGSTKINLVGYSRGAFIAMCFAKYLQINDVSVNFLGLFDAVSIDASMDAIVTTEAIPNNVKNCYHSARSPITGSRNVTMNRIGTHFEDGRKVNRSEFPGSHAAIGGFPNEAGIFDAPTYGQGNPKSPGKFHPRKEITAWWESGNKISVAAIKHGLLSRHLAGSSRPAGWLPETEWYNAHPTPKPSNNAKPAYHWK